SIVPGIRATLSPTGNDLDHAGADDALLFTFSEDVRTDSLSSALVSTPAIRGTLLRVSEGVYALIPDARLVMGQQYTLRIAATMEDLSGNKLAIPYERSFTPDIPIQTVTSIKAVYASTEDEWTIFNALDAKPLSMDVTGVLRLVIRFAEPFSVESGAKLVSAITFDGFFPGSTADPSLVSAVWTGGLTLSLVYAGLANGTPEAGNYYKLTLPGGAVSSDNGSGSFLKEDVWMYFTTSP
ncbi:MAG TPA: Ig-like domain-containing protein, partial [Spirochaetia bacterium]|nr:Ig-like domain-containing protein [Spirochaetia bacterium]